MSSAPKANGPASDTDALPAPRVIVQVECQGCSLAAYRDFDGKWKNLDGEELIGTVIVRKDRSHE